jgi:hypothetical protein
MVYFRCRNSISSRIAGRSDKISISLIPAVPGGIVVAGKAKVFYRTVVLAP